ncbi:ornithine cyclodeaminase family protein [Pseudomonas syringae]|uniref:ornithine cyclodeaminase family protein n=1 Tax=Pseudomonas syringae TaxID=317 RepID=UPI000BB617C6|nr:ornithine cyclodeaminase [Pseudomonas syringae]PBQ09311.1 ornithine cyclodeaminase [Pseudomonas syringae]
MQVISAESINTLLDWEGVIRALHKAHLGPRPQGAGFFLGDAAFGLLSRGVLLPGSGAGIKIASMCPANGLAIPPRPMEDAAFIVIDEQTKAIAAILDGPAITRWKTPADSVLAARKLSREDSRVLLVLGGGPIAAALVDAYLHVRPSLKKVLLWNRTPEKLDATLAALTRRGLDVSIVDDLDQAVSKANIVASATSSSSPLIRGEYVRHGTHVDLLGGYRPDMQEADNTLMAKARIYVDDQANAASAGDICIPLACGAMAASQIEGDLFDLCQNARFQRSGEDITVYKNAGGAQFDLIVSQYVIAQLARSSNR